MKKAVTAIAFAILLVTTGITAKAQSDTTNLMSSTKIYLPDYDNKTFHFGFLIAFNEMTFALKTVNDYQSIAQPASSWPTGHYDISNTQCLYVQSIEPILTPAFSVGIIGNLRLSNHFNLRFMPSLSIGERRMHYNIGIENLEGNITKKDFTKNYYSTFMEFPLNLKYRILRHNNIGPYLIGGINPKISLDLLKANKIWDINSQGISVSFIDNFVTKRFDFAAEFGVGLDLYTKRVKLGIELKMSEGLLDVVKAPAFIYTAPIEQLRSRMFQVSVLVE